MNEWDVQLGKLGSRWKEDVGKPFVVDIGALDGYFQSAFWHAVTNWGWGGLMVEPVVRHFKLLQKTYENCHNVICHRGAIDERDGWLYLKVAPDDAPMWQWGSSTAAGVQAEMTSQWSEERVPTCTLQAVLDKYGVSRVDAISIDTEGMDWIVLAQLDLERYRPSAVKAEINLLGADDQLAIQKHFTEHGYEYAILDNVDIVAWPRP